MTKFDHMTNLNHMTKSDHMTNLDHMTIDKDQEIIICQLGYWSEKQSLHVPFNVLTWLVKLYINKLLEYKQKNEAL